MATRAENRKFHFTYKVTCINTNRVFFGLESTDVIDPGFLGTGMALSKSKKDQGLENHYLEIIQHFESRVEAKNAYNQLKASELRNPKMPGEYEFHFVYMTVRNDGKFYIGVHSTNNLHDKYLGSGTYLARSIRKHGRSAHKRELLEMCNSRDHAFEREIALITPEVLADPMCMNSGPGGQGGNRVYGVTEETRKLIGEKSAATPRTKEWCAKIGAAHKGKTISPEVAKAQSERMTGYKWKQEHVDARIAGQKASAKFKERYKPIEVDGVRYDHAKEAVEKLGIAASTLRYRIMSPSWESYKFV